jgi:hypothetical protein
MHVESPEAPHSSSTSPPTSPTFFAVAVVGLGLLGGFGVIGARQWLGGTIANAVAAAVAQHQPPSPPAPPPAPRNITSATQEIVLQEAAQFVLANMTKTQSFPNKFAMLEHSVKSVPAELKGLYCEFGVYKGETVNFIASKTPHEVHGFDSFEGLPEVWREGFEKGTFALTNLPKVAPNVTLHKGWFNESLPIWKQKYTGPIAFMHMDADLYSSTKCVFDLLADRVVPGTVIQFDEFFNYPGWKEGEYKAFTEFVRDRKLRVEYIGYNPHHEQVAVRIVEVGVK